MTTIAYISPFVPAEWVAAHGVLPHRLRLGVADGRSLPAVARGVCPYAAALGATVASGLDAAAVVLTTTCDQMRHAAALLENRGGTPVFLLGVPATWQEKGDRSNLCAAPSGPLRQIGPVPFFLAELERLGRFLVTLGGKTPDDAALAEVMLASDHQRDAERRRFAKARNRAGVPLALLGGPLLEGDERLFDVIEHAGGQVVLDGTEGGQRTEPRAFDPVRAAADPLAELADAYLDIPDPARRPNNRFYEWLSRELASRQVRGIVLRRYVWCDLWHAEVARLRQSSGLPVLEIDVGPDDNSAPGRVHGRIEAFLETLR